MVKSSDLWLAHTNSVDETIEKAGIPVLRKGWECKHCGDKHYNKDLARLVHHICNVCKNSHNTLTPEVREKVREDATRKEAAKDRKRAAADEAGGLKDDGDEVRAVKVQASMRVRIHAYTHA